MESTTSRLTKLPKHKSKHLKTEKPIVHNFAAVHQFWPYLFSLWTRLCCMHRTVQPSENSQVQLTFTVSLCQCSHHRLRCDSQHLCVTFACLLFCCLWIVQAKEMAPGTEIDGRKIRVDFSITQRAHTPTPGVYLGRPSEWVVAWHCHDIVVIVGVIFCTSVAICAGLVHIMSVLFCKVGMN